MSGKRNAVVCRGHELTNALYVVRRTGFENIGIHFVNSKSSVSKINVIH